MSLVGVCNAGRVHAGGIHLWAKQLKNSMSLPLLMAWDRCYDVGLVLALPCFFGWAWPPEVVVLARSLVVNQPFEICIYQSVYH